MFEDAIATTRYMCSGHLSKLKKAGSFDRLYKLYEKEIQKRDKEVEEL